MRSTRIQPKDLSLNRVLLRLQWEARRKLESGRFRFPAILFSALIKDGGHNVVFETVCGLMQARKLVKQHLLMVSELRAVNLEFLWTKEEIMQKVEQGLTPLVPSEAECYTKSST